VHEGAASAALIIGVGNRLRGDDGVGPAVCDRLAERGFEAVEHAGDGAELMDLWQDRQRVFVVDATSTGAPAGTISRFEPRLDMMPRKTFFASSHLFGLTEAVETSRALGRLPDGLVIYGVEGQSFAHGDALSEDVAAAVASVADQIATEARR